MPPVPLRDRVQAELAQVEDRLRELESLTEERDRLRQIQDILNGGNGDDTAWTDLPPEAESEQAPDDTDDDTGDVDPEAPYGRKKDGTPRKRPGRPRRTAAAADDNEPLKLDTDPEHDAGEA